MPRNYNQAAAAKARKKKMAVATRYTKAKPAASQGRLKKAAAKTRSITPYPANAKAPLVKQGPLPGAGPASPGVRKKAPALTAKQKRLVFSAMPKAKAQRTPQQIAAMKAYRAAGKPKYGGTLGPAKPKKKGGKMVGLSFAEADKIFKQKKKKRKPPPKSVRTPGVPHSAYPR